MKQWTLGIAVAGLAAATFWGVWHAQTLLLQVCVVIACGIYMCAGYLDRLPRAGGYAAASMFVAGAALGALAYHGEAALLYALMWLAAMIWIEVKVRHWLGDLLGTLSDLLG